MATQFKRVAGMATMPSRAHTAPRALQSLLGQFDTIYLVLNNYSSVPGWAKAPGVEAILPESGKDYGAAGKLLGLAREASLDNVIYYCVDDDIRYPGNFAGRLARFLARHNRAMVGVHGSAIKQPFKSWRKDRKVFSFNRALYRARQVDVVATCACAFFPRDLPVEPESWPGEYRNCVDLWLANMAARHKLERWVIARHWGWVRPLEKIQRDSIYKGLLDDESKHVKLALDLLELES